MKVKLLLHEVYVDVKLPRACPACGEKVGTFEGINLAYGRVYYDANGTCVDADLPEYGDDYFARVECSDCGVDLVLPPRLEVNVDAWQLRCFSEFLRMRGTPFEKRALERLRNDVAVSEEHVIEDAIYGNTGKAR